MAAEDVASRMALVEKAGGLYILELKDPGRNRLEGRL